MEPTPPPDPAPRPRSRLRTVALVAVGLLAAAGALVMPALGVHRIDPQRDAEAFETQAALYDAIDALYGEVVRDGGVDYRRLVASPSALGPITATFVAMGPSITPERFASDDERLAWYINAYNALTLAGVVTHWPITTVHDVHGWIRVKAGFGFFGAMRFRLDGRTTSLYQLEHDVLRDGFGDARIHAAINCASRSCPALTARAYRPETLDAQLDAVSRVFASHAPHVVVDNGARQIRLSAIYDWFAEDFVTDAREAGWGGEVLDWIEAFALPDVAASLRAARTAGYEVVYVDYDWSLNAVSPAREAP